jgi:voltage-gated potassium channel
VLAVIFITLTVPIFYFPSPGTSAYEAREALVIIEVIIISFITIEYCMRLATAPNLAKHLRDKWSIIDLLTFLPFWVSVALYFSGIEVTQTSAITVRFFNCIRYLRLIKFSRKTRAARVLTATIKRSAYPVLMFFQNAVIIILFSATIVFFAELTGQYFDYEQNQWILYDGSVSEFQSIPISLWWAVVTIATVGYGDMVPQTPLGKAFASIIILTSLLVVALPVGIFATKFVEVSKEYEERFSQEKIEKKRQKTQQQQA